MSRRDIVLLTSLLQEAPIKACIVAHNSCISNEFLQLFEHLCNRLSLVFKLIRCDSGQFNNRFRHSIAVNQATVTGNFSSFLYSYSRNFNHLVMCYIKTGRLQIEHHIFGCTSFACLMLLNLLHLIEFLRTAHRSLFCLNLFGIFFSFFYSRLSHQLDSVVIHRQPTGIMNCKV